MSIDGDTIVVGAWGETVEFTGAGAIYMFARTGSPVRVQTAKLTAADPGSGDQLGFSVRVDGDTIIGGAPEDDVGANTRQGSASIFYLASAQLDTDPPETTISSGPAEGSATSESDPELRVVVGRGGLDVRVSRRRRGLHGLQLAGNDGGAERRLVHVRGTRDRWRRQHR